MKYPCGRCTIVIAPSMIKVRPAAVNLVRNPASSARLPNDLLGKIVLVRTKVKGALVQRLTVPFDSDCQRHESKEGNLPELEHDFLDSIALEQDASHNTEKVGQRQ